MGSSFIDNITRQTMSLDLTKTVGGRKDIESLCTDLFLIVIRMREAEDLGEPAALRKLITYYLQLFEKNSKAIGISDEATFYAKYAIVALIDETVLSVPGACKDYWLTRPLQLDLFGDNLAGEEFYNKLQKLLTDPEKNKDVLEIYYLCLSLGFEGKYKLYNGEERINIIEDLGRKLRRTRMRASSGISPHGSRTDFVKFGKKVFLFPLWLSGVLSLLILMGTYIFFYIKSSALIGEIMDFLGKLTFR